MVFAMDSVAGGGPEASLDSSKGSSALAKVAVPQAAAPIPPRPAGPPSWEGFVQYVRPPRPLLASFLENGSASQLPTPGDGPEDDVLMLRYPPGDAYYQQQLQSRVYSEQLSALAKEYFGRHVRVRIELGGETGESMASRRERERREREQAARSAAQNHPIIAEARALFGGELGPIELMESMEGELSHAPR
jgi:hypothetical protein